MCKRLHKINKVLLIIQRRDVGSFDGDIYNNRINISTYILLNIY